MGDYSIHHQFASSTQYQGTLPSIFGTTSTTPLSAFNSQKYCHPTMHSQVQQGNFLDDEDDKDDEGDDEKDEEEPQLVRGGSGQPRQRQQQQEKKPSCGTSSDRGR
ncbi:hypothetical protein Lal_00036237 [Lupinus albus]|nr:hypothetical protein Lal_00036237 [Lupinus albus]